jgi:hypothetical protein
MASKLDIPAAIQNYYNYRTLEAAADLYSTNAGHNEDQTNAFAHAFACGGGADFRQHNLNKQSAGIRLGCDTPLRCASFPLH